MSHASHTPFSRVLAPLSLILVFLVSRSLILASLRLDAVSFVANDVGYYGYHLFHLSQGREVMLEYPVPAVWILQVIYTLGGGWQHWAPVYVVAFLALDIVVAATLYRRGRISGALFWILFTGANGAIVWYRFDLLPAALVAWACLCLVSHPRLAGSFIGLGAAIKLWPALLIAPMLAPHPWRCYTARRRWTGFVIVGAGLATASLVTSGWARSISPVVWQSDRGLQMESVPATPLMFLRSFTSNPSWNVFLSQYNALELDGPAVAELLRVSTILTVGALVLAALLATRLIRNLSLDDPRAPAAILLAVNTVILATIISNKTLSPQYVLWLGGPTAVLLLRGGSAWLTRHIRLMAGALVVVGGLTQATYPWLTYGIMALPTGSPPETAVLILRNLALVLLTGYSCWLTLRTSTRLDIAGKLPVSSRRSLRPHVHTEGIVA